MGKWSEKHIIGLTGNIGTGKSVVRRMLEHLGAYGIDADAISHRAISKESPCFNELIRAFGDHILDVEGQIDRKKLGKIVFNDQEALTRLESIVHPMVEQAVDIIIKRSSQQVVVIEAIKLLESQLVKHCDAIWVVVANPDVQLARLMHTRHMTESDAKERILAQVSQESRLAVADVVIKNNSTYEDTWNQVSTAWQRHFPKSNESPVPLSQPKKLPQGEVSVERVGPKQVDEIVEVINYFGSHDQEIKTKDVMASFGEKAYLILKIEQNPMGYLGWQVENLIARTTEIALEPALAAVEFVPIMVGEMEKASIDLQCEISLISLPDPLAHNESLWKSLGYKQRTPASLSVLAWQEAAEDMVADGKTLLFKQLRQDRVLRPI